MPNNQPTDADIEAEAKRWALDIAPQDTAFSPTMNAVSWWGLMSAHERNLARAHARYVLERRGRPEDVEAVARIVSKAYSNTESAWESVRFVDVALAIIAHYGPPPSPPQITDADVERCMIAYNHAYDAAFREHADLHAAGIRAAITAFLNPPPPDPIRAAETLHAPTSPRSDLGGQAMSAPDPIQKAIAWLREEAAIPLTNKYERQLAKEGLTRPELFTDFIRWADAIEAQTAALKSARDLISEIRENDHECFTVAGDPEMMNYNERGIIAEYDAVLAQINEVMK